MSEKAKEYFEGDIIGAKDINAILLKIQNANSNISIVQSDISNINIKINKLEEDINSQEPLAWGAFDKED